MEKEQKQEINIAYNTLLNIVQALDTMYFRAKKFELYKIDEERYFKYRDKLRVACSKVNEVVKEIVLLEVENL